MNKKYLLKRGGSINDRIQSPEQGYLFMSIYAIYLSSKKNKKVNSVFLQKVCDCIGYDNPAKLLGKIKKTKLKL